MKTLYININNEQIASNEELEVLNYDLDSDFFFYLGEKIAKGCKVENENALITDFNTKDNEEEYKQITTQWNEIKTILFSEECKGRFELTLPNGYIHWLKFHPQYVSVYHRNFSHGEPAVITIDLEELYEDSIEDLQRKILRKLQRDEFYLEIDEIVFNDDAVTRKSPIILKIKDKYEGVGFKAYKKWSQENEMMLHSIPQICEKCKKNPCECNTKSISSDSFFPYKGFTLGETSMNDFKDDSIDDGYIIHYDLDNGVTLLGATEGDTFIAAMVDSKKSSNNKLPKEWSNLLGCRFGASHEKCRRALSEKDFDIILDSDADILVLSPNNKYRIHLFFDVNTSKFVAFLITLNECPYCNSKNFTFFVKPNTEIHMSCCVDCCRSYLPFEVESEELDEAEDEETLSCPNCSSDDVDDDGSDYLQYTCNDCGHNWGHDDTVECPECGSDDVENDGTDNLQYKCNACGEIWGDREDDEVYDNGDEEVEENETPSCPNCSSDDVDDDGSDFLQYTCNDCGHNWGHDDTVECPECGSDNVENDGTDNMQYECNACGHIWGDDEVYDNDDEEDELNYDHPLSLNDFFPVCGITLNKSTVKDAERQSYRYAEIEYCDSGCVIAYSKNGEYHGAQIRKEANSNLFTHIYITSSDIMFPEWSRLGFDFKLSYNDWISLFKRMGFTIIQTEEPQIKSWEHGPDYFDTKVVAISKDYSLKFELEFSYGRDGNTRYSRSTLYSIGVYSKDYSFDYGGHIGKKTFYNIEDFLRKEPKKYL